MSLYCQTLPQEQHWQAASEHEVGRLQEGRGGQVAPGARDAKAKGDKDRADLFASTLPVDANKAVLVLARQDLGEDIVAVLIDVGGWRPLLEENETCSPRLGRGLLLPPGESGHGAQQGGADNVPQCDGWNSMRGS